jgi:hypothetical protein
MRNEAQPRPSMSDLTRLWHYSRPKLAAGLATRLRAHERIAMFGPRQTGKTTLLRDEVMPILEAGGALPVYIECWADRANPLASINYALQKALSEILVPRKGLDRAARTPVKRVAALGLTLDFGEDAQRPVAPTPHLQFDNLLVQLLKESGKDLVLLFDEFQVIANVPDGDNIGAAIRAALTQASNKVGALFSGSSDTELIRMFSQAQTPLYGFASAQAYPLLDVDFIGHVARRFHSATKRELVQVDAQRIFDLLGRQPEPFLYAVSLAMSNPKWTLDRGLAEMLSPDARNKWSLAWSSLTDMQRATLRLVFDEKLPTSAASREWVAQQTGQETTSASSIARALESLEASHLIERSPPNRTFTLSDPVMRAWLTQNKSLPIKG